MIDAHKMGDGEVRDPRQLTAYVGAQIMRKVEQVVRRDALANGVSILHEIHTADGAPRLGFYRVCLSRTKGKELIRNSHIFDIQMCMDLRDGWDAHVEKKTLTLLQPLFSADET